ncbi:MAG: hypothetical protein GF401_01090 [Chitinivibrionales bacterium]|nr:hypothetical protein [Chitinivibrionales bacterium]
MENRFKLELLCENRIIEQTIYGDVDDNLSLPLRQESDALRKKTANPDKACVLINTEHAGKATSKARRKLYDILKEPFIHKFAVFGIRPYVRAIVNFIMSASGSKKIRVFSSREKAIEWLLEDQE